MNKNNKTIWHYFKIYFLSLFLGLAIFGIGSLFKPAPCANSATCKSDLSISIDNDAIGIFQGRKITPPKIDLAMEELESAVLGVYVSNEEKHIYVDLSRQTLYAYEGNKKIMQALISSGKWGRTPTGNFNIWIKLRATRMAGGQGADAYDLPNVPWVMYYYNDFGLHGAYWHNNFGYPMSHGCVNMRPIDARELYNWIDPPIPGQKGTAVSVCDQFVEPGICVQDDPIN
jgi:hypothetical protein